MKTLSIALAFLSMCFASVAAPPPPILYTRYTTNTTPTVDAFLYAALNALSNVLYNGQAIVANNVVAGSSFTNPTLIGQIITPFPVLPMTVMQIDRYHVIVTNSAFDYITTRISTNIVLGQTAYTNTISPTSVTIKGVADTNTMTSAKIRLDSNIGGFAVTLNDDGLGTISTSGQLFATNGATVTGLTNLGVSYLSGNVGIGTASPDALLHLSGQSGGYGLVWTNPTTAKTASLSSNGTFSVSGSISSGSTISSGASIEASSAQSLRFSTRGGFISSVDRSIKIVDRTIADSPSVTDMGNGATLHFNTVDLLPIPSAANGILTNRQWGIGNTNGDLTFMSGNGAVRIDTLRLSTNALTFSDVNNTPLVTLTNAAGAGLIRVASQMESAQPIACYGALMMNTTNILATGGAYTNVQNYNVAATNQFTRSLTTGYLTNQIAGYYRVTVNMSFLGAASETYELCHMTNGVDSELISTKGSFDNPPRLRSQTAAGIIYLPANTASSMSVKNTTAGNIAIHRASLVIGTP
jgi:hypothetical protein